MHTFIPHEIWIRNIHGKKKKGICRTQNVLGWEIFYYCSWCKFSVFHSNWQQDSAHHDNTTCSCTSASDPYMQHVSMKHRLPHITIQTTTV